MARNNSKLRGVLKHHGRTCHWCDHPIDTAARLAWWTVPGEEHPTIRKALLEHALANAARSTDGTLLRASCSACVREAGPLPWLAGGEKGSHGGRLLKRLLRRDGSHCCLCGSEVRPAWVLRDLDRQGVDVSQWGMATIEHLTPRSKGGSRWSVANMGVSCWRCNRDRGNAELPQGRPRRCA